MRTKKRAAEDIVAPERLDTMRDETECPECGSPMEQDDHVCEVCGYEVPPEGLNDPDLTKAREFDQLQRRDEQQGEYDTEAPEEDGGRPEVDDSRGPRRPNAPTRMRSTTKTQDRRGNSRMRPKTRISLQARVASLPSAERLREMGWSVLAGTPSPDDTAETHLIEDGRKATDEPRNQRVVSDQAAPVTSRRDRMRRRAMGESTATGQPYPTKTTPQYPEDSKDITQHTPGKSSLPQGGGDHSAPDMYTTPQYSEDSKGITEHTPGTSDAGQGGGKKTPPPLKTTPQYAEDAHDITEHHPSGIPDNPEESDSSGTKSEPNVKTKDNSGVTVPGERGQRGTTSSIVTTRVWKDAAGRVIRREEIIEDGEGEEPEAQIEEQDQAEPQQAWSKVKSAADDDEDAEIEDDLGEVEPDAPVTVNLDVPIEVPTLSVTPETTMMAALKTADAEVDLGLLAEADKYDRVAQLQEEGIERIAARLDALRQVKTAGLSKKKGSPLGARLPSLRQASTSGAETQTELPDEAVFSLGL